MQHRKDIDGLRCLAVLPIVLFHAGLEQVSGGYIGVDVFFVISGFLITRIIVDDLDRDTFGLVDFYRRRVIRIVPALLVLIACSLFAGIFILLPHELEALGRSAVASSLFVANFFFWYSGDYFSPAADTMPLLHIWSLGVEEQFYLLYPLALIVVHRFARKYLRAFLVLTIVFSLLIGALFAIRVPTAGFYLLPSRAWELCLGGFVATLATREKAGILRNGFAMLGLYLIVSPLFLLDADSLTPVPAALTPCLGTAIVLACGPGGFVGSLLSLPPFRFIGRISYSLYLWHWPIITFYRLQTGRDLELTETLGLTAASLIAGIASYYLVERRILLRFRHADRDRLKIFAMGGAGVVAVAAAGAALTFGAVANRMVPLDPAVRKIAAYSGYATGAEANYQFRPGPCYRYPGSSTRLDLGSCAALDPTKRNVLVFGDSHAAQYWRAIALRYPDANVMQVTAAGCRPLLGSWGTSSCLAIADHVFGPLIGAGGIDTVVLAGRWRDSELRFLPQTLRRLNETGAQVVVIGPSVEYDEPLPILLAEAMMRRDPGYVSRHRVVATDRLDRKMRRIVTEAGMRYVSVHEIVCEQSCKAIAPDGGPMNFDTGHLTMSASRWVVERMPAF